MRKRQGTVAGAVSEFDLVLEGGEAAITRGQAETGSYGRSKACPLFWGGYMPWLVVF